jgi:hypothetical protein
MACCLIVAALITRIAEWLRPARRRRSGDGSELGFVQPTLSTDTASWSWPPEEAPLPR